MSHQFDYLIILFYRVKESNLPKTSCKGAVTADEPTRYKVSGWCETRTRGPYFRSPVFKTGAVAAVPTIQNIKKLPSQEQDSNPYFQLNICRATNYTIQLSFLNEGAGGELNPPSLDPQSKVITVIRPVHC